MSPVLYYRDPADQIFKPVNTAVSIAGSNPVGTVVSYVGGSAPAGWHLCDGSAHGSAELKAILGSDYTPDLRGRFILAASAGHPAKETGGAETHQHTLSDAGHAKIATDAPSGTNMLTRAIAVPSWTATRINTVGASAANGSPYSGGAALGGSTDAGSSMPPYYALVFIIKKFETAAPGGLTKAEGDSLYAPVQLYGRNRIINGDFSVNQRGFSSQGGLVQTCGFDRWFAYGPEGTVTYTMQLPPLGTLPESARNSARVSTSGQTTSTSYAYLAQKIEGVTTLSGKTVTLSFWAKSVSGTPKVAVEITQFFGSGGSSSVNTYCGQVTLSTSWARYSVTVQVPSIAGKTLGSDLRDVLFLTLWVTAGSDFNSRTGSLGLQNNGFDFWGVQLEEGTVATQYEQKTYAEELRACQRYYQRWIDPPMRGVVTATNQIDRAGMTLSVPMRTSPLISFPYPGNLAFFDGTFSSVVSGTSNPRPTPTHFEISIITATSGFTVGRTAQMYQAYNGQVNLDAEL